MARSNHTVNKSWIAAAVIFCLGVIGCSSSSPTTEASPTFITTEIILTDAAPATQTSLPTTGAPGKQDMGITVPAGSEASIDGVLAADEWEAAKQVVLDDESQLFLMHAGGYLYIGIRTKPEPVTSICIDQPGRVEILHSSAAIGTAIYQPGVETWEQVSGFEWCCRDTTDSGQAREERGAHLQEAGWIASNGRMGNSEEVEYQIELQADSVRLAVSSIGSPDYETVVSWPGKLSDGCSNPDMLKGPIPEQTRFSQEEWITLTMAPY